MEELARDKLSRLLRPRLRRSELLREKDRAWNEYARFLARGVYEELTTIQRIAYLAYWYNAEVQNGGHMQYFLNLAGTHAEEAVVALPRLGANDQGRVLSEAVALVRSNALPEQYRQYGLEIFTKSPLREPLSKFDRAYCEAKPTIEQLLHLYLQTHFDDFIYVIEDGAA